MNLWLIGAIVLGLLAIAGIAMVNIGTVTADAEQGSENSASIGSCSSCRNACTLDNNCGLSTCGAVNGRTCGCGR